MPFLGDNEFLAHFWQYDPVTFFRLSHKTKSDFFVKISPPEIVFYAFSPVHLVGPWKTTFGGR